MRTRSLVQEMSSQATALLYLNMGGEMLYVLQQRLNAQGIDFAKSAQVLDDVTAALLNPKVLSSAFEASPAISIPCIRSTLECIALSSIMRLDKDSMDKLFDLTIMMVKYQLTAATGPREVVLLTLNHTDAMRDMVTDESAHECVSLVHQMVVDLFCNMTMGQVWQTRNDCLKELDTYRVRVSILLRLGLQDQDASFVVGKRNYDEKYEERRDVVENLKLNDTVHSPYNVGSFELFGNRATLLGRNIYLSSYGLKEISRQSSQQYLRERGTRAELGMLAAQLGTEETTHKRPFNLNLFTNMDNMYTDANSNGENNAKPSEPETESQTNEKSQFNEEYKSKLDNVYSDFFEEEQTELKPSIDLLELLDEIE